MSKSPANPRSLRYRSRLWLLAALLMLVAGQTLALEHHHGDRLSHHSDCSVCVLSAAGGNAAFDRAAASPIPALAAALPLHDGSRARPAALRFCDSRAPPSH